MAHTKYVWVVTNEWVVNMVESDQGPHKRVVASLAAGNRYLLGALAQDVDFDLMSTLHMCLNDFADGVYLARGKLVLMPSTVRRTSG